MSSLEARLASKDATEMLTSALALVRAAGYRVSKPKQPKKKDRVGPTFVARFADSQVTRMSTWTSLDKLDVERGIRLSRHAWKARHRTWHCLYSHMVTPAIVSAHFEQDGNVLATYDAGVAFAA